MSYPSFRHLSLLVAAFASISCVTASPPLLPRYPYRPSTGTAVYSTGVYPTGTSIFPTGTSFPTYHPTGSVSSTLSTSTTPSNTSPTSTTLTHPPPGTPTTFKIKIKVSPVYPSPPPIDGYALLEPASSTPGAQVLSYTDDAALASTFTINADGTLSSGNLIADMPAQSAYQNLLFQTEAEITRGRFYKTYCSIDEGILECSTNTGLNFDNDVTFTCSDDFTPVYGPTSRPYQTYCFNLELFAISL